MLNSSDSSHVVSDENNKTCNPKPQDLTFADFGVQPQIVKALAEQGIIHPFPIQALTLPVALTRQDIIGQAKTGTGKTLGFTIPILHQVIGVGEEGFDDLPYPGRPQALVVLPTRELAKQVAQEIVRTATFRSVRVLEIYGGIGFDAQLEQLKRGCEIVVGTPGRLIDLIKRRVLKLSQVKTLVLDEADEMLDLGFLQDVEMIVDNLPPTRHTMLFSATMPNQVVALARRYMSQPTHIRTQDPTDQGATVKTVKQLIYRCHPMNKTEVVARILQAENRGRSIIFARTKRTCSRLEEELTKRGFAVAPLHGDMGQAAREQSLRAFRNGKVDVLVATDVAARGIDVEDVTHVINYQCPEDEKVYLHRIGRTGRAGSTGYAITFVDWEEITRWNMIDRVLNLGMPNPTETYHTSDHLYTDLNIPLHAGEHLPVSKRNKAGLKAEAIEDLGRNNKRKRSGPPKKRKRKRVSPHKQKRE